MNMCPSRKIPPESWLKGQLFFLWSNQQNIKLVKEKIALLGGKVDEFLSQNITTILIDDFHLATYTYYPNNLPVDPSFFNVPHIIASAASYQGDLYNLPSTSQGYNVNNSYRVIKFALEFRISICGIAYFLASIEPQLKFIHLTTKKKSNQNVSNLQGTFIKFESQNKKFRPCFKVFGNDTERLMPLRNASVLVRLDTCENILTTPVVPKQVQHISLTNGGERMGKAGNELKPALKPGDKKVLNKAKPKEENNYCECCRSHYTDLKLHLASNNHLKFVNNEKNYETVTEIMKLLPTAQDFMAKHQKSFLPTNLSISSCNMNFMTDNSAIIDARFPLPNNKPIMTNQTQSTLQMKEIEDMPLDLHVETLDDTEMPNELLVHPNFIGQLDEAGNSAEDLTTVRCEPGFDLNRVKTEPIDVGEDDPVDEKPNEVDEAVQNEQPNQTVPADVPNSASLAQICLKNFDSYWLDSLPDEEKDIYFDDNIFDLDDGQKIEEFNKPEAENLPQTTGLGSCIASLPLNTSLNISLLMNSAGEVKDIGDKSDFGLSPYKMDFVNRASPVPGHSLTIDKLLGNEKVSYDPLKLNATADVSNPVTLDSYKIMPDIVDDTSIVDVENFEPDAEADKSPLNLEPYKMPGNAELGYFEKPNLETSCSNMAPDKSGDKMFSDDSEDEVECNPKIGNSFIYNVLNIITNSESEVKTIKVNQNLAPSSDSGMKLDSKVVSSETDKDKNSKLQIEADHVKQNFSNVIKSNINIDSESAKNTDATITSDALSASRMDAIANKGNSNTCVNFGEVEVSASDSGLNLESNDMDIKSLESQSGIQPFIRCSTIQSTYPLDIDKNVSIAENLCIQNTCSASDMKYKNDLKPFQTVSCSVGTNIHTNRDNITIEADTKCLPAIKPLNGCYGMPLPKSSKFSATNLINICEEKFSKINNPGFRKMQDFDDTTRAPKQHQGVSLEKTNESQMFKTSISSGNGQYDKFKRSSKVFHQAEVNAIDEKKPILPNDPPMSTDFSQVRNLSLSTINTSDTDALRMKCYTSVSCDKLSGAKSLDNPELKTVISCTSQLTDKRSDAQTSFKPRDHTVQIPKKRYTSTISKNFEIHIEKSSALPIKKSACQNSLTGIQTDFEIGNKSSVCTLEKTDEPVKQSPLLRSDVDNCKIDPPNTSKQSKPLRSKHVKPVKRKRCEVYGRRTRRKSERKHSSSDSKSTIYGNSESKPVMNYTSYRLSQSKNLPNVRMPPKKSLPKLKKLPSIWKVNKIHGSGIRLRFTCLQQETFRAIVSCDEYEFNE
ncbi:uncharacterized protein [Parasteatoda tepidariorum]|uniref:uncharacterized protein n=1 Tax=Parasteatoda tepidariorum TaxID=114398 RepID=UPI001C724FE9|nr:uncharacterized protein LOC107456528 [Parasteatoda tepidariorum]